MTEAFSEAAPQAVRRGAAPAGGWSAGAARAVSGLLKSDRSVRIIVPDSLPLRDLQNRRRRAGRGSRLMPYSALGKRGQTFTAAPGKRKPRYPAGAALAYTAGLHLLPNDFIPSVIRASWKPVYANEAYVLFYGGKKPMKAVSPGHPGLRGMLWFHYKLADLKKNAGVYRSRSGIRYKCRICASDIGAVEEARNTYIKEGKLPREGLVIDIGAHIGAFSVPAGLELKKGKVLACEPDPHNFRLLVKNIRLNGLKNVTPLRTAVSSVKRKKRFYASMDNPVLSGFTRPGGRCKKMTVAALTLKDLLGTRSAQLVKIDAEGSEYDILFAFPGLVRDRIKNLIVEAHFTGRNRPSELVNFLRSLGFSVSVKGGSGNPVLFAKKKSGKR